MRQAVPGLILVAILGFASSAQAAPLAQDDELDAHLANQRDQLRDSTIPLPLRGRLALDMAATLDRAARSAENAEERRARWAQAVTLLDDFDNREGKHDQRAEFEFQAAVYIWAQAESWAQQAESAPGDRQAPAKAAELLDAAIKRLEAIKIKPAAGTITELLEQNVRFRLAQARADRAALGKEDADARQKDNEAAAKLLEPAFSEPALGGFAVLLRAELLVRLGRLEEAQAEIRKAEKLKQPPPGEDLIEAQLAVGLAAHDYQYAMQAIARAKLELPSRILHELRVLLAEREERPEGDARSTAESEAFKTIEPLRKTGKPEERLALMALARGIKQPDANQPPEAWDTLAEGALALGETERASKLEQEGADLAESKDRAELAATLRNRAGAMLFQAGQFARADAVLTRVFDDPKAGALRAKAGMLRILARGRGVALKQPGCTREAFLDALTSQLREFPDDPSASEARWLLGKLRLSSGEREQAIDLFSSIPQTDSHWLPARLALAQIRQDDLDNQLLNDDRALVKKRMDEARRALDESEAKTSDPGQRAELALAHARLDLTPGAGKPENARDICERIAHTVAEPEQRRRAAGLQIVALAELGRFVDAEREARKLAPMAPANELLSLARLLDRAATATDSDVFRRRLGQLMTLVTAPISARSANLDRPDFVEARLRQARGLLLSGHFEEARRILQVWPGDSEQVPDNLLDDLADSFVRLDAHALAIDVYRLRARQSQPGSLPWFRARYGLALSYYRTGRLDEARRLIDATAILHPEMGGGDLKTKFEHLRQRLGDDKS